MIADLPPAPPPIVGRASVIDGDTLEVAGQRIRLWGIDAPESRQTCDANGRTWRCGQQAALALGDWLGQYPVACTARGRPDRYRRIVAVCHRVGPDYGFHRSGRPDDVGGWLVRQGWALDHGRYSDGAYGGDQEEARTQRRGLWQGTFVAPWNWRTRP